jgi:tetratricopeptide (TPR) repeat protein
MKDIRKIPLIFIAMLLVLGFSVAVYAAAVDELISKTKSEDMLVWAEAIIRLGMQDDVRAVETLIEILQKNPNREKRKAAVSALKQGRKPGAFEVLLNALNDTEDYIRESAAWGLGYYGDLLAVEPLIKALRDKDSMVRWRAAGSLGQLRDKRAVGPLIEALKDKDITVRSTAATALGELNDQQAVGPLIEANKDNAYSNSSIRSALSKLNGPEEKLKDSEEKSRPRESFNRYLAEFGKATRSAELRRKVIAFANTLTPPPAIPEEAEKFMARGKAAFQTARSSADFKAAAQEYEKAANLAPWWADVYFNLGVVQEKQQEFDEAVSSFELYLLAAPDATDAKAVKEKIYSIQYLKERRQKTIDLIAKGLKLNNAGSYQEALTEYKEAIRIDPENGQAHAYIGHALNLLGRYKDAIPELKEAIRLGYKELLTYLYLQTAMEKTGVREDEQIAIMEEGLREGMNAYDQNSGLVYFNLGAVYNRKGEYKKAIEYYQKSIDTQSTQDENKAEAEKRINRIKRERGL